MLPAVKAPLTEAVARALLGGAVATVRATGDPPPTLATGMLLAEAPVLDARGRRVGTLAVAGEPGSLQPAPGCALEDIAALALVENLRPDATHEQLNALTGLTWFARLLARDALSPAQRAELLRELAQDARSAAAGGGPQPARARR